MVSTDPFGISSHTGASAYQISPSTLDELWDSAAASVPSFVVSLILRAREGRWNVSAPQGIIESSGQDILTNYHSITNAEIEIARTTCANTWATQNSKAMFPCFKSSIKRRLEGYNFYAV